MTLIPGQPFPDLPAWESIEGIFANGWIGHGTRFLRLFVEANNITVSGRLIIGNERRVAGYVPERFWPPVAQSMPAFIQGGPPCIMEFWVGGGLALSNTSLGMTEAEMLTMYAGKDVYISGSYPRRA